MSWLAIIRESEPHRRTRVTAGANDITRELAVEAARAASNARG